MSTLTLILSLPALIVLGWAVWFIIEFIRYLMTGEYEVDKRLQDLGR